MISLRQRTRPGQEQAQGGGRAQEKYWFRKQPETLNGVDLDKLFIHRRRTRPSTTDPDSTSDNAGCHTLPVCKSTARTVSTLIFIPLSVLGMLYHEVHSFQIFMFASSDWEYRKDKLHGYPHYLHK